MQFGDHQQIFQALYKIILTAPPNKRVNIAYNRKLIGVMNLSACIRATYVPNNQQNGAL